MDSSGFGLFDYPPGQLGRQRAGNGSPLTGAPVFFAPQIHD